MTNTLIAALALIATVGAVSGRAPGRLRDVVCAFSRDDSAWTARALEGWTRENRRGLHLPQAPVPVLVLFDDRCGYVLRPVKASAAYGFAAAGRHFAVSSSEHGDSIALPDGSRTAATLTSFASPSPAGMFFVMSLPTIWRVSRKGPLSDELATAVFMHEFTHTQSVRFDTRIDTLVRAGMPADADDDVIQDRFADRAGFRDAYTRERDLFYGAAAASSAADVRRLARRAADEMDRRRAAYFTGSDSVYADAEDVFLTLEGAGQWAAYLWLTDPEGAGMNVPDALAFVRRGGRWWSQDEGLALALVLARLAPNWAREILTNPSAGMIPLLHRELSKAN